MTYYIYTEEYAYYPDDELKKMSAEEKKAAKRVLTDDYELDEGVDFGKNMTKAEAEKLMNDDLNAIKESISNGTVQEKRKILFLTRFMQKVLISHLVKMTAGIVMQMVAGRTCRLKFIRITKRHIRQV